MGTGGVYHHTRIELLLCQGAQHTSGARGEYQVLPGRERDLLGLELTISAVAGRSDQGVFASGSVELQHGDAEVNVGLGFDVTYVLLVDGEEDLVTGL